MVKGQGRSGGTGLRTAMVWAIQLSGVSLELATCVVLGYLGDQRWGTSPWLLVLGSLIGFTISMLHLWRIVRLIEKSSDSSVGKSR